MTLTAHKAFVAMFYALDAAYDDNHDRDLGSFLSAANPFLFKGEGSADVAVYDEFRCEYNLQYPEGAKPEEARLFVRGFLDAKSDKLVRFFDGVANASSWADAVSK